MGRGNICNRHVIKYHNLSLELFKGRKMPQEKIGRVVLLISCPDRKGIVAGVSNFIYSIGGNILQSDQYTTDPMDGVFFLRIQNEWLLWFPARGIVLLICYGGGKQVIFGQKSHLL